MSGGKAPGRASDVAVGGVAVAHDVGVAAGLLSLLLLGLWFPMGL